MYARARAAPKWNTAGTGPALLCRLPLHGEYAVDLAEARLASDGDEMAAVFGQILAVPMVAVSFYVVRPVLFYIGLLVFGLIPFGLYPALIPAPEAEWSTLV